MKALFKIVILIIFFVCGTLSYDTFYDWSLNLITFFSDDKIYFFGKLWDFLGKPSFGYLLPAIPILGHLGVKHYNIISKSRQLIYWAIYFLCIGISYFVTCYFYFLHLVKQIEMNKIILEDRSTPMYNVNIYTIASVTIIMATIFQYVCYHFLKSKKNCDTPA